MIELLVLAVTGALGAFMHRTVSKGCRTWSRETAGSCFLCGSCSGSSTWRSSSRWRAPSVTLPAIQDRAVAIAMKAALLGLIAYVGGDAIQERLPVNLGRLIPGR